MRKGKEMHIKKHWIIEATKHLICSFIKATGSAKYLNRFNRLKHVQTVYLKLILHLRSWPVCNVTNFTLSRPKCDELVWKINSVVKEHKQCFNSFVYRLHCQDQTSFVCYNEANSMCLVFTTMTRPRVSHTWNLRLWLVLTISNGL